MDNKAGKTIVKAEVPMAEMLTYGTDLTSMTQGRGSFSMEMHHYDFVPALQQDDVLAQAKAGQPKDEDEGWTRPLLLHGEAPLLGLAPS